MAFWGGGKGGWGGGFQGRDRQFNKPESALKRAEELCAIDKKEDALTLLNESLRLFRRNWTQTTEDLVSKHLDLCVELRNTRLAKDCIIQYRSICQQQNTGSLEQVVKKFRTDSEKKAEEALKVAEDLKKDQLDDLDEEQDPDAILLGSVQTDVRKSNERELHAWFRYLWETYKMILDTLRNNKKLEETYHETARIAFTFCSENKRPQEFKRLCEMLRFHYQNLAKPAPNQTGAAFVSLSDPLTVQKLLDTRFEQLKKATAMELWREAFATAEDIHMLMTKRKPRPFMLAQYYDSLQKIFWKSENYLFHAFAMLKYYLLCKQNRKHFPKDEEEQMASELLLASAIVPHDPKTTRLLDNDAVQMDKNKRLSRLLGSGGGVPTRQSLNAEIRLKKIYENACEPAQRFYDMLEGSTAASDLSEVTRPVLKEIVEYNQGKLSHYEEMLKTAVCLRILIKLADVYSTMKMDRFKETMNILPWIAGESITAEASKTGLVQLKINYADQTIVFGAEDSTMKSMRNSLIAIGTTVFDFETTYFAKEISDEDAQARKKLYQSMKTRREDEESEIIHRRHVIEDRKQVREKEEQLAEEESRVKAVEEQQKEEELVRQRMEEETKRRDKERAERTAKEKEAERNKAYLETIKEKAGKSGGNIKVGDKTLKEIDVGDLDKIDMSQLEQAREGALKKEREVLLRNRKAELKRVDHTARALRDEETLMLPAWREKEVADLQNFVLTLKEKKLKDAKEKYDADVEAKTWLGPFEAQKAVWFDINMESRLEEFEEMKEREKFMKEKKMNRLIQDKIDRARAKKEKFEEDMARKEEEERERERRAEERAAEEEKRREEAEERARVEERKRAKEEEMEAKRREERDERPRDAFRSGRRDDDDDARFNQRQGGRFGRDDDRRRDDEDTRFSGLRGAGRDDRGPPSRRDDDDERFNFRQGGQSERPRFGQRNDDRRDTRDDRDDRRRDDDGDSRFAGLRGQGQSERPRFGQRDDRRDDRDDRGPPRRNDDDDDERFAKFRQGGQSERPRFGAGRDRDDRRDTRDDRRDDRRDDDGDSRFAGLRSGGGDRDRPRFGKGKDGDDKGRGKGKGDDRDEPRFRPPARGEGFGGRRDGGADDSGDWRRR